MKTHQKLLFALILAVGAIFPLASSHAQRISIEVGDRPYYSHGPWYVEHGRRWEWVPGHWSFRHHQRVWIHGHYRPR